MDYRYIGLLAFVLLTAGLAFVVYRWPLDRHETLSKRAATNRTSILYYFGLFLVVESLFIAFFTVWFTPTFHISWWFNTIFIASAIFQIACTLVPEIGGKMTKWHTILAGTSALLLAPTLLIMLATGELSMTARLITFMAVLIMGACIFLTLTAPKLKPRNFLLIQCMYYGSFVVPVMIVCYLL